MHTTAKSIRLLLVDDEVEFLEAMKPGLTRRGFAVRTAADGHAALHVARTEPVDAVVLDVKMPGIDGVDTFRALKGLIPGVPVLMLTGHGSIPQAFETSREGVADYLAKPCDVDALADAVRRALAARGRAASPPPAGHAVRVLLVDDDRDFVGSLLPALARRGVHATAAHGAAPALDLARARRFDVAVVDVRLPDADGLGLVTALRAADPLLEVIVLTGHPAVDDVRHGLLAGAFDYLPKPQPVDDLVARVRDARERRRVREEEARRAEADRILSRQPD
jgi:DNA-binding NtrC family response regulator